MFKKGDKVICINASYITIGIMPILELGKIYTIKAIQYCMFCGTQTIDVGTTYKDSSYVLDKHLCKCKKLITNFINTPCASNRFIKLDELDEYLTQMEQEENYEMCAILLKIKQNQLIEQ